jgi:hypothetical protein
VRLAAAEKNRRREAAMLFERYQYALTYSLHIIYVDEVKF